jgi:hypothetical protein
MICSGRLTPWQKVFRKFGLTQSKFAEALNRNRSKVSRALKDRKGLINGRDQELILEAAKKHNVNVTADDMVPSR